MTANPNSPAQSRVISALALLAWLLLCFAAAALGGLFLPGTWYAGLKKPAWNPPAWIFGPLWSALYTMMALAAWLLWRRGGFATNRTALGLFLLQLLFNAAWSPLFFGLHNPALGLADIILLWLTLTATLSAFWKKDSAAALLLVPYLLWVTFAAALNFALWRLNG